MAGKKNCLKRKFAGGVGDGMSQHNRDVRNIARGQCQACGDCSGFISMSGRVMCDYCGCPPAQHENLAPKKSKNSSDLASFVDGGDSSASEVGSGSEVSSLHSLEILELDDEEADDDDEVGDQDPTAQESESSTLSVSSNTSEKASGYFLTINFDLIKNYSLVVPSFHGKKI
jgi:hypothetical protein